VKKFLVVVTVASLLFAGHAVSAQKGAPKTYDSARLQATYAEYNESFFNNSLPKNTTVQWADIPMTADDHFLMGVTHENFENATFKIDIDTKSNITWVTADTTLLHEMCHVKTTKFAREHDQDLHGPAFKACIVDLEMQGAFTDLL